MHKLQKSKKLLSSLKIANYWDRNKIRTLRNKLVLNITYMFYGHFNPSAHKYLMKTNNYW